MQRQPIAVLTVITVAVLLITTVSSPGKIQSQQTSQFSGIANAQPANVLTSSNHLDTPLQAVALFPTDISAGNYHTCVLLITGAVKCWGNNDSGQLGDGSTTKSYTPVDVVGLSSGVTAISASNSGFTCAVLTTGAVKCWGSNGSGQLGNGSTISSFTSVDVVGLSSRVKAISTGYLHTCALLTTGAVKCWGYNFYGQLGNGSTINSSTPVDVVGLSSGVTAISARYYHTCALLTTGAVKCWGYNRYGQLGNGSAMNSSTPVDVVGLSSEVSAISAGDYHTCAVLTTDAVKCWGRNDSGQLGNGSAMNSSTPVDVVGLSSGVKAISAGGVHTCAVFTTDAAKCWGWNYYGQLGDGSTTKSYIPVDVVGLSSGETAISASYWHTCAILTSGAAKCWGFNAYGQLGDGSTTKSYIPVDVVGLEGGPTYSIDGRVSEIDNSSLRGAKLTLSNGWATYSDGFGNYMISGLASGTYTITPTKTDYVFSPSARTLKLPPDSIGRDFKATPLPVSDVHFIDLTISLYKSTTIAERVAYTSVLGYFADAVYEMSNGTHKIRTVTIYDASNITQLFKDWGANIKWNSSEWPRASVSGYGRLGMNVMFGDSFPFDTPFDALAQNNRRAAGYALAHEWGHYYYGLYDEYVGTDPKDNSEPGLPHSDDVSVPNSIMNSQWNAVGGDYSWLNFSIAKNMQYPLTGTAQARIYHASGWQTLVRWPSNDPPNGLLSVIYPRQYYPELAKVAPIGTRDSSIELSWVPTQTTRSALNIVWPATTLVRLSPQTTVNYVAVAEPLPSTDISYPEPALLSAHVAGNLIIARVGVSATVTNPDGSVNVITLRDDGVAPDSLTDDGLYSGLVPYKQNGDHVVAVQFDNHSGNGVYTSIGYAASIGPNGETFSATLEPVTEDFTATVTTHILVSNYQTDDHGNTIQTATEVYANKAGSAGQIDYAGDIDVFKVVFTGTAKPVVRVANLALDMLPKIRILQADGTTSLGTYDYMPQAGTYFSAAVDLQNDGYFYVEISHQDSQANIGLYNISVTGNEPAPVVSFTSTLTSGMMPFTVAFTDTSTGVVSTRLWEFGDGVTSADTNPSHIYTNPGIFTVTLAVGGPGGSDVLTKTNYIVLFWPYHNYAPIIMR